MKKVAIENTHEIAPNLVDTSESMCKRAFIKSLSEKSFCQSTKVEEILQENKPLCFLNSHVLGKMYKE